MLKLFWGFSECVCLCAIPLPVLNRAFQVGHCLNIPNMQEVRSERYCLKNNIPTCMYVQKQIFPYCQVSVYVGFQVFRLYLLVCIQPLSPCFMSLQCALVAVNSSPGHILSSFAKPWQFPYHIMWDWKARSMQCNSINHSRRVFSHELILCGKVCKHGLDMIKQNHVWIRLWSTELMIIFGSPKKGQCFSMGQLIQHWAAFFYPRKLFEVH